MFGLNWSKKKIRRWEEKIINRSSTPPGWRRKYSGPGIQSAFEEHGFVGMNMRPRDCYTDLFVLLTNATSVISLHTRDHILLTYITTDVRKSCMCVWTSASRCYELKCVYTFGSIAYWLAMTVKPLHLCIIVIQVYMLLLFVELFVCWYFSYFSVCNIFSSFRISAYNVCILLLLFALFAP